MLVGSPRFIPVDECLFCTFGGANLIPAMNDVALITLLIYCIPVAFAAGYFVGRGSGRGK